MLPAAIAGAFGGVFAWFEGAYSWMTPLGVLTVAGAWLWILHRSAITRRNPPALVLAIMGIATVSACIALLWPRIEGPIRSWLVG